MVTASPRRREEVTALLAWASGWAHRRGDVAGLLLVGSWARDAARDDSDVDMILLSDDPTLYNAALLTAQEPLTSLIANRVWGPVTEWRFRSKSGLEIELGVASPEWARTSPVDAGTRRVVSDGVRTLYDPRGLIADLIAECAPTDS
ncbi:nucleotidyltransferase domain-containing protein [Streptomonospora salina]|uniref:Putative nucleotidyltransferase n=1 Tax=Streptomonospora salina TaxID=104205 RepID=A0A841E5H2_9ACTN|nr:nucleotidyltransferase domain-containing protein [Streptomonospora salina]MBB5996539.1 putative nucleotidyltransferase [Streptomonospora salina]